MRRGKGIIVTTAGVFAFALCLAMEFTLPTEVEQLRAIGSTEGLPEILRRAFERNEDFAPIPSPQSGDWLEVQHESGQTFGAFKKSRRNKPDANHRTIYLQPIGEFPEGQSPSLELLREYGGAFFALDVETLPPLSLAAGNFTTRTNPLTGNRQILTVDVLDFLKERFPSDAFCVLAITMEDLYPDPSWNFVFGQASLHHRVAVFSFARYDPAFHGMERTQDAAKILLRRSCKVLVHELAHVLGVYHCIYFHCVMNGSNHLEESDSRPLHLCPVDLRKLQHTIGFDVVERYRLLLRFYEKVGFHDEAQWTERRLKSISSATPI